VLTPGMKLSDGDGLFLITFEVSFVNNYGNMDYIYRLPIHCLVSALGVRSRKLSNVRKEKVNRRMGDQNLLSPAPPCFGGTLSRWSRLSPVSTKLRER
jgi:hypothetical protein